MLPLYQEAVDAAVDADDAVDAAAESDPDTAAESVPDAAEESVDLKSSCVLLKFVLIEVAVR